MPHHRFVYRLISQRARGLSVGINMNPDGFCNFDCVYCEVDRRRTKGPRKLPVGPMLGELGQVLQFIHGGAPGDTSFSNAPTELLTLKEVALSGDGEPTLCPNFGEALRGIVHLRSRQIFPFFKIVLITNATGLDRPGVQRGLELLTDEDEVWAKLDAGSQSFANEINRPGAISLELVVENIRSLGKRRPVIIQSMFTLLDGQGPPEDEIDQYISRLQDLKESGAQIPLVQVYSAHRLPVDPRSAHLPLKTLSSIARRVRQRTSLRAEVF